MRGAAAYRSRRSIVQLTSMMDLLFVLIFAFMLKTSNEVEVIASKATESLTNELSQAKSLINDLTLKQTQAKAQGKDEIVERRNVASLETKLALMQQRIEEFEKNERRYVNRISELSESVAQLSPPAAKPLKKGRWELIYPSSDSYFELEGWDSVLEISSISPRAQRVGGESVLRFVAIEKSTSRYGIAEETFDGSFNTSTRVLTFKTRGFTRASGGYSVSRLDRLGLGYVLLQNPSARARAWAAFPSDMTATLSVDGSEILAGGSRHPDPDRQLTGGTWKAKWIGP